MAPRRGRAALPWLAPAIVVVAALTVLPTLRGIWLSFTDASVSGDAVNPDWIGLDNYRQLWQDPGLASALWVTVLLTVIALAVEMLLGVAFAVLLSRELPFRGLVRAGMLCTMVLSPVVVGTVWRLLLNSGGGPINGLLTAVGLPEQSWLSSPSAVVPAIVVVDVWQWTPLIMLITLAGLQSIPVDIYDAVQIDGARALQTFRYVTLPLLAPSLAVALLIRFIDVFRTFDLIYSMTGGGPGNASENLAVKAYYAGFQTYDIGFSSAIAVIIFAATVVISAAIIRGFGVRLWQPSN